MKLPRDARRIVRAVLLFASAGLAGEAVPAPFEVEVRLGDELAVTYRARLEGEWLVVEARHEPGWHTYAMDNLARAREKTGREKPDTELPTVLTPSPGTAIADGWRQSEPLDLSQPDIEWYTWGFEDRAYFAARVSEVSLPASVRVEGQACTEERCAMIDALEVPVMASTNAARSVDPASLSRVGGESRR